MRGFVGTRGCGSQRCCRCGKSRRCPSEVDSLVTTVTGLYRPCTAPNATNSIYSADIPWNNTRHAARIFLLPAPVGSTSRRSLPRIGCAKMHTPLYPKRSETPPHMVNLHDLRGMPRVPTTHATLSPPGEVLAEVPEACLPRVGTLTPRRNIRCGYRRCLPCRRLGRYSLHERLVAPRKVLGAIAQGFGVHKERSWSRQSRLSLLFSPEAITVAKRQAVDLQSKVNWLKSIFRESEQQRLELQQEIDGLHQNLGNS
ncbi:hypothetical protein BHM03_00004760 [Ensete ventricosum]|uniref:Uncharacterized protein n=1 Tax=Ensete ventricosum TaxID=4639 RepID=A0A445MAU7_ENSVE|nr:hypothetical protein BHM03_00004760 [Ensete ventricosum]